MRKLLILSGLMAASALASFGGTVFYDTASSELCLGGSGCGVLTQTLGNVILTYNPVLNGSVDANDTTFGSFGQIIISCVGGGTGCANQNLTGLGLVLNININQTGPSAGTAIISGTLSGNISGSGSSAIISWPAAPVAIGPVTYGILNNPLGLVPPSIGGITSIQAVITDSTTPEPASMALISVGLLGIGLYSRKKQRKS